jgi:hypothetical protein
MADFKGSRIPYFTRDLSKNPTVFSNQHPPHGLISNHPLKRETQAAQGLGLNHARMRPVVATSCHNISASAGAGFKRAVCPLPAHLCFLGLSLAASFWAERAEHQASLKSTLHYEL